MAAEAVKSFCSFVHRKASNLTCRVDQSNVLLNLKSECEQQLSKDDVTMKQSMTFLSRFKTRIQKCGERLKQSLTRK